MTRPETFISHEEAVANFRMYGQMVLFALLSSVVVYLLVMFLSMRLYFSGIQVPVLGTVNGQVQLTVPKDAATLSGKGLVKYYVNTDLTSYMFSKEAMVTVPRELVPLFHKRKVRRTIYRSTLDVITDNKTALFGTYLKWSFLFFPLYILCYFLLFRSLSGHKKETHFVRGTDIFNEDHMLTILHKACMKDQSEQPERPHLTIGNMPLPFDSERRHALILGTTGTGKSVFLNHILSDLEDRRTVSKSQKAIIYDVKGEFVAKHYSDDDLIFYPFDVRSIGWSFFNEVRSYPDLDMLATSLYQPPKQSNDAYWYNAARDVFRTGLFYLYGQNMKTNRDIWEFFSQPLKDIRDQLSTLPSGELGALKHIDRADSNQAASVISILQERLQFFRYLIDTDGDFSFRDYITDDRDNRFLYLMNIKTYDAIFKPLMTFIVDIMIREVLSIPDSRDRQIFFLVDEFGSLGLLSSIFDFLTLARSKGGVMLLSNQDLGSVGDMYGQDKKTTFYNNFNVNVIFRVNCPTTTEFLSKAFGDRQVIKTFENRQMSPAEMGDRMGLSEQEKTEKVILATEFQSLQDFEVFLKLATFGITKTMIEKDFKDDKHPYFLPKDYNLQERVASAPTIAPTSTDTPSGAKGRVISDTEL